TLGKEVRCPLRTSYSLLRGWPCQRCDRKGGAMCVAPSLRQSTAAAASCCGGGDLSPPSRRPTKGRVKGSRAGMRPRPAPHVGRTRDRRYDGGKEVAIIELAEQPAQALENSGTTAPRLVNPRTRDIGVLLRVAHYEHLADQEYKESPWTQEELEAVAREVGE